MKEYEYPLAPINRNRLNAAVTTIQPLVATHHDWCECELCDAIVMLRCVRDAGYVVSNATFKELYQCGQSATSTAETS